MIAQIGISHLVADGSAYTESELLFAQAADRTETGFARHRHYWPLQRDEFLIVLTEASGSAVAALAANKIVRTLGEPFEIKLVSNGEGMGGVALFPEHGQEAETLLHHAEIAREERDD